MAEVYLSLGSNINREHYICAALEGLTALFGELVCSSVYESEAVGFEGDNFFNLVVGIQTTLSPGELARALRQLEAENDRNRASPRFSARTLDVDILSYDTLVGNHSGLTLPRAEISENAFVLQPLAEISPDGIHPVLNKSYADLWQSFDKSCQQLWPIAFNFPGDDGQ
ncbi:MAG: 2-amino-4-hydroxy-6-hydroxymethyldihydropteridine diphosphokinase [Gammaproteobacteria bacterium]|nr:2-amino-4-hydroxy-6-hydroxymethyldihydropteridine diphosphokinase [Gammaproteobacteria bacterium]